MVYVAEIGSMHKGSPALACEMARAAQEAGADILKMQLGHDPADKLRYVGREFAALVALYCERIGIEYMASIFSPEGLDVAQHVAMKRYKIAHQKSDDWKLVFPIVADGKETFISYTKRAMVPTARPNERAIFTTDTYPTLPWDLKMPESFGEFWHGYSDHTHGIGACLLAVARGANYIEKHFTLDKTDLSVRDTPLSASPAEFAELVRLGRQIEQVRDAAI